MPTCWFCAAITFPSMLSQAFFSADSSSNSSAIAYRGPSMPNYSVECVRPGNNDVRLPIDDTACTSDVDAFIHGTPPTCESNMELHTR